VPDREPRPSPTVLQKSIDDYVQRVSRQYKRAVTRMKALRDDAKAKRDDCVDMGHSPGGAYYGGVIEGANWALDLSRGEGILTQGPLTVMR
jgi:hypothetical protein